MTHRKSSKVILHAPNIHHGGGLTLLKSLLSASSVSVKFAQFDRRAHDQFALPPGTFRRYICPTVRSRLNAEWRLRRFAEPNDVVLCFHSLPPIFSLRARVIVFIQNRILVSRAPLNAYSMRARVRLKLERWLLRVFAHNADKFIVQTPSMASDTRLILGSGPDVAVLPYASSDIPKSTTVISSYDFVYIASDEPHKNHTVLLQAWRLLAEAGHKPSLALTVSSNSQLADNIEVLRNTFDLNISNLGTLPKDEIHKLYDASSALIFPSYSESFGLPLIEASQHGLPVLAPELDYVRDVVEPVQTFDPHSPVSLARAVKRFLGKPEPTITLKSAEEFFSEVMK